ncbi:amidohydrolase [Luteimonas sp. RD2P54]|uniref:Amidohydrolase n=1 Tax=Luteimonas endophytica TaxID=3042023 RepID=A0ABT6J6U5_9GAMM|nr:amidohydrolase [Luteimonas endophytica]MDH5822554.1 amidohydrolase [Luteimonas endophytica]
MPVRAHLAAALLALPLFAAAAAQEPAADALRPEVAAAAQALQDKVVAWRRDIHQHPELSNRETRTAAKVAEHLRALGLEPTTGIAHTGVTAVLKGGRPGPRIALRADMDALPVTEKTGLPFASTVTDTYRGQETGVMHACGHDAHTAILMGVAEALVGMREELAGEILFVFQPAEEGAPEGEEGGAALMLEEGVFRDFEPEAVFGLHVFSTLNADQVGVRAGPTMAASDRFGLKVIGRQTHGSRPWGGVDPIVAAAQIVSQAQTIVSRQMDISKQPVVVTFGAIEGGIRYNIIPDEVEMVGTIRTFDEDMRKDVFARLNSIAEHVAAANGATVEAQIPADAGNPVTFNNEALTARMRPSLEAAAGPGNLVDMPLIMGAEDFSLYAQQVPGLFFFVGATPVGEDPLTAPSNHSPQFDVDESALDLGLRAMLQLTLDYLEGGGESAAMR